VPVSIPFGLLYRWVIRPSLRAIRSTHDRFWALAGSNALSTATPWGARRGHMPVRYRGAAYQAWALEMTPRGSSGLNALKSGRGQVRGRRGSFTLSQLLRTDSVGFPGGPGQLGTKSDPGAWHVVGDVTWRRQCLRDGEGDITLPKRDAVVLRRCGSNPHSEWHRVAVDHQLWVTIGWVWRSMGAELKRWGVFQGESNRRNGSIHPPTPHLNRSLFSFSIGLEGGWVGWTRFGLGSSPVGVRFSIFLWPRYQFQLTFYLFWDLLKSKVTTMAPRSFSSGTNSVDMKG